MASTHLTPFCVPRMAKPWYSERVMSPFVDDPR